MSSTKPLGVCMLALIGAVFCVQWKETRALAILNSVLWFLQAWQLGVLITDTKILSYFTGVFRKIIVQYIRPKNVFYI